MTTDTATTVRISTRQLAESAYRALRVAGVPSGVADDAARDTVALEAAHGRGLTVLDDVLHGAPALRVGRCDTESEQVMGDHPDLRRTKADAFLFDAHGSSALLLSSPLVAVLSDRCQGGTIRALGHPAALTAALCRRARRETTCFELATAAGEAVLTVRAGAVIAGPAWGAAWSETHTVRVSLSGATGRRGRSPDSTLSPHTDEGLDVEPAAWQRLQLLAARYLV